MDFDARLLKLARKRLRDVPRPVGHGKHAVSALRFKRDAKLGKVPHHVLRRKCAQSAVEERPARRRVFDDFPDGAVVREVAPALTRDAQLDAEPVVFLKERGFQPALGRLRGREHAGGSAADDDDIKFVHSDFS